jgi:hypothetical protein
MRGPIALALSLVLVAGVTAAQPVAPGPPADRVPAVQAPVVVDVFGLVVGPLVGVPQGLFSAVQVRVGERDALLVAGRGGLAAVIGAQYESTDCSGPPLIRDLGDLGLTGSLVPLVDVGAIGKAQEILVPAGAAVTRFIQSEWVTFALLAFGSTGCQPPHPNPEDRLVRPTSVLTTVDTFTPPFRLR